MPLESRHNGPFHFEKRWNEAVDAIKSLNGGSRFRVMRMRHRSENFRQLQKAFRENAFIYGTVGPNALHNGGGNTGNTVTRVALSWFNKTKKTRNAKEQAVGEQQDPRFSNFQRELNLYDPGPRTGQLIKMGHQMMDMYYGMDNKLFLNRIPLIAEFVHHAMYFHKLGSRPAFSAEISGRDAYFAAFPGEGEGWRANERTTAVYGQSATKEMSKVIREGIKRFGGTLIFEGKSVFGAGVFDPGAYQGDTDLEAQSLFEYFNRPRSARVAYGKGWLEFQWGGKPTVPTKAHFLTNWHFAGKKTHRASNQLAAGQEQVYIKTLLGKNHGLRPIWDNFEDLPPGWSGPQAMPIAIDFLSATLSGV